jgi:hypothetical protein
VCTTNVANTTAVCDGTTCTFECQGGFAECGGDCRKEAGTACTNDSECCAGRGEFCDQYGECSPYVACRNDNGDTCTAGFYCETLYGWDGWEGLCTKFCDTVADCPPGPEGTAMRCTDAPGFCEMECPGNTHAECPTGLQCFEYEDISGPTYACGLPYE